jgi:hypothetical protein
MIGVHENLGVAHAVDANVRPKPTSMAANLAAKHQKPCAGTSHLPLSDDWRLGGGCRASQTVVFIQVSVSSSGLGSDQC